MKKLILVVTSSILFLNTFAQEEKKTTFEISGQIMTDIGYDFKQINPDYWDVMRPTQLPAYPNEYGTDGNMFFSVRQSSLGFKSFTPTKYGQLTTNFAFDLFGVGADAGQTTFHLLYAWAEIGKFGIGYNWSLFSDFDGFPKIVEYWGPSGMSLCKNIQLRYIPLKGDNRLSFALERPGASADQGIYSDRIALEDVNPRFPLPDLSGEFRITRKWGYAEIAGLVRRIEWVDQGNSPFDLSGKAVGWGFNLSTNLKLSAKDLFIGQTVIGSGIENYMNDAPTDIAIQNDFSNHAAPIKGVALPVFSFETYLNHQWSEKFSSAIGYSMITITNSDGQLSDSFRNGKYASTNLLYYPVPNVMAGVEFQWIKRENYDDGFTSNTTKIQFSFRYSFDQKFYTR